MKKAALVLSIFAMTSIFRFDATLADERSFGKLGHSDELQSSGSRDVLVGNYGCFPGQQLAELTGTSGVLSTEHFQCAGSVAEACDQAAAKIRDQLEHRGCKVGGVEDSGGTANMNFVCADERNRLVEVIAELCGGFLQ